MQNSGQKKPKSTFDIVHMTNDQINHVKKDIAELEQMLKADRASRRPKIADEAEFRRDIETKKQLLKDHSPQPFESDGQKNKAYAAANKLREFISNQMPTARDYYQNYPKAVDRYGNPISPDHRAKTSFERAVNQQVKFQTNPKILRAVHLYKNIMRRLDPADPTITNIELLRRR